MTKLEWKIAKAQMKMRQKRDAVLKERIKKAAVIGGVVLAAVISIGANNEPEQAQNEKVYVVKGGDTLWNITAEHLKEEGSNKYILQEMYDICEKNPEIKSGRIYPGQKIILQK
ncbi:MAG: LysM peptidoglycan-binding domain-containing protein [Selenomonadaceae bacterium]|nr:LysM peptidoglycan-binding domain-containing protein [Selenomonadaceae bacterium]MBO6305627.1 LysM peptidoglycan-binding domain-containing protein [Selenomonadaceae bacterium]